MGDGTNLITQIREPPDICQINCETDDGQKKIHICVPGHPITLVVVHDHT